MKYLHVRQQEFQLPHNQSFKFLRHLVADHLFHLQFIPLRRHRQFTPVCYRLLTQLNNQTLYFFSILHPPQLYYCLPVLLSFLQQSLLYLVPTYHHHPPIIRCRFIQVFYLQLCQVTILQHLSLAFQHHLIM